jgi:hypothetical protein
MTRPIRTELPSRTNCSPSTVYSDNEPNPLNQTSKFRLFFSLSWCIRVEMEDHPVWVSAKAIHDLKAFVQMTHGPLGEVFSGALAPPRYDQGTGANV